MKHTRILHLLAALLTACLLAPSIASCAINRDTDVSDGESPDQRGPAAGTSAVQSTDETIYTTAVWQDSVTAAPETAMPDTKVPETTVQDTSRPDTTVPDTTVPETAAPVRPPVNPPVPLPDDPEEALAALGRVDFSGREFTILTTDNLYPELESIPGSAESGSGILSTAVYQRNTLLEERLHICIQVRHVADQDFQDTLHRELMGCLQDIQLASGPICLSMPLALENAFLDAGRMRMDLAHDWWDPHAADFKLASGTYFLSGSANYMDDNALPVILCNRDLRETFELPDPYGLVKNNEWTLEKFQTFLAPALSDLNGDGQIDETDIHGFTVQPFFEDAFYIGAGLRHVILGEEAQDFALYLKNDAHMERGGQVLTHVRAIYHDAGTFLPEDSIKGYRKFESGRALFYGGTLSQLHDIRRNARFASGVLPLPKFDRSQTAYAAPASPMGSAFLVPVTVHPRDQEAVQSVVQAMAILSHQYVLPAYQNHLLAGPSADDPDTAAMLDLIRQSTVYDIACLHLHSGLILNRGFENCVQNPNLDLDIVFRRDIKMNLKILHRMFGHLYRPDEY